MDRHQERQEFIVGQEQAGARLDRVLEGLLPGSGLRHRRRLVESGRVLVNGAAKTPAYKVRCGQVVALVAEQASCATDIPTGVCIVARSGEPGKGGLAAVYKPQGMHSAEVAGGGPSLEARLPGLFPGESPVLLNRLDFLTSGLLMVALSEADRMRWLELEAEGSVLKTYQALALGALEGPLVLKRELDTADRAKTRVLGVEGTDPTRWTEVEPVRFLWERGASLVRVRIRRGARHQIRAHLAAEGHPLVGDPLYGGPQAERLYLHHAAVELPGFTAWSEPDWEL